MPSSHMSSGPKKKEPREACLSEVKASHSHKMWTEVSSSVPHFLHMGSLHSPMICKCLLKVLCPVSRPVTVLVCVLLRDSSRAPIARSGPIVSGNKAHSCGLFCQSQLTVSKGCHKCHRAPLSASFNYVRAAILKGIYFKDKTFFVCLGAHVNILDTDSVNTTAECV
jgi:hypothetical protein